MKILVVGAGATGGFFGAQLMQAGRDVTFLVRPRRADVLRERGLRIDDLVLKPQLMTADQISEPYDLVLMTVKASALSAAVDDVTAAVGPQTTIVPFLNGMAHMDLLNARFGADAVFGGVVKVITTVNEAGDIVKLAPIAAIVTGAQDRNRSSRVAETEAALGNAGFDLSISPDIVAAMWHKWVFISTLGALTSLMRGTVGDVVAAPGGNRLGPAILAEAAAVAAAAGYPVPEGDLAFTTGMVTRAGSTDTASIYRDLVAGQPTEVEHIFGDLTTRARKFNVDTPLLDLATMSLRVYEGQRTR